MLGKLDDGDRKYLRVAVELSRSYRDDPRRWPFGAILVGQGKILGRGFNQSSAECGRLRELKADAATGR